MSTVSRRTFTTGLLASALVPGRSAIGQPNDPASIAIIDTPQNAAKVASKLAARTGDRLFDDYFTYIRECRSELYLQRILEAGSSTRAYKIDALHAKAKEGVPALMMTRTNPRSGGYEQTQDSKP